MPEFLRQVIDVVEARPLSSALILMAAILYIRFMASGPRAY